MRNVVSIFSGASLEDLKFSDEQLVKIKKLAKEICSDCYFEELNGPLYAVLQARDPKKPAISNAIFTIAKNKLQNKGSYTYRLMVTGKTPREFYGLDFDDVMLRFKSYIDTKDKPVPASSSLHLVK